MISHHHETLFVHIPKCGGQSIESMFLADLGLSWATRAPLLLRLNKVRRVGPPSLAHLLAPEYTMFRYMTDRQFASYFKFAFVRNPYNRTVSLYNFLATRPRPKPGKVMDFERFMSVWLPKQFELGKSYAVRPHPYAGYYWFARPQADFVFADDDVPMMDALFRLEDIASAIPRIREMTGVRSDLKHVNKTKKDLVSVRDLTADHVALINSLYARDFRLLDYPQV